MSELKLKKVDQQFRGQVTDITDEKLPKEFFLDSLNIRFNTDRSIVQGGFMFEKGNKLLFKLSTIKGVISDNPSISYIDSNNPTGPLKKLPFKKYNNEGGLSELSIMFQDIKESGEQEVIEVINSENGLIIFSTDSKGFDCIWEYEVLSNTLELKYVRNMNFSLKNPIKAIYNYENELVRKVYWIDGKSQIRFINLDNSIKNQDYEDLIDVRLENTNQVGLFNISQPIVEVMSNGGQHTAGTIQYAYNLYKINGNQTKLSPLTRMVSLGNGSVSGGNINDNVTDLPKLIINDLDPNYTNIRIYAIKYTAFNVIPETYIVLDGKIDDHSSFVFYDTGSLKVQDISLEQMIFIGSDPIYPKEIETKDNHLFVTNYDEAKYTMNGLDMRCFSVDEGSSAVFLANKFDVIFDRDNDPNGVKRSSDSKSASISLSELSSGLFDMPDKDMILTNLKDSLFCADKVTPGMEGKFIKLTLSRIKTTKEEPTNGRDLLKDREIYRFAIKFYNGYGQYTDPFYMGDYYTEVTGKNNLGKRTRGNESGNFIHPTIQIKNEFKKYLEDKSNFLNINGEYDERLKPVGYKLLRAIRKPEDRLNIVQGIINPMLSMHPTKDSYKMNPGSPEFKAIYEEGYKMPWLLRSTGDLLYPMNGYTDKENIGEGESRLKDGGSTKQGREVFTSVTTKNKKTSHLQFNKMMQMYSPELSFSEVNSVDTNRYRVVGYASHIESSVYGAETNIESKEKDVFAKVTNRITPRANIDKEVNGLNEMSVSEITGNSDKLLDFGMVGPTGGNSTHEVQFYRNFNGRSKLVSNSYELGEMYYESKTYGKPLIAERGQGETSYNGDPLYTFTNKYDRFRTDTPRDKSGTSDPRGSEAILRFNSTNERNITFVDHRQDNIEDIVKKSQRTINPLSYRDKLYIPIVEFFRDISYYYMDNMYGGNKGERRNTEYIEVGNYIPLFNKDNSLDLSEKYLGDIGDTFFGPFVFQKTSSEETLYTTDTYNCIEIVSFQCETTIDIFKRSDLSIYSWDSYFMSRYKDFSIYNRVYSQQDNIFKNVNDAYNFKTNSSFTNRILATKKKSPGELIDSWTDMAVNNVLDVDGKYGPINAIKTFNQNMLVLQNSAISVVSVNPRVQTLDTDGNSIELGSGGVLHDYRYITTEYGCIHKWATVITKNGFYFYDELNKTICLFNGESVIDLCKTKGVNSMIKEIVDGKSFTSNPLKGGGVVAGYDRAKGDVYFVFDNKICIVFNEVLEQFAGRLSYETPKFSNFGDKTYSLDRDSLGSIFIHSEGKYGSFYNRVEDNYIKFLFNPEPLTDCGLTNISYRLKDSEVSKNELNWNSMRVSNDYQDTGFVPFVNRKNFRLMDRSVNITVGRDKKSKGMMRDNWHTIELIKNDKKTKESQSLNNTFLITYKPTFQRND